MVRVARPLSKFRFQTGSIKSDTKGGVTSTGKMFRFQTGSIKRLSPVYSTDVTDHGFDSKLVRLKVHTIHIHGGRCVLFRFQTGSIKSG